MSKPGIPDSQSTAESNQSFGELLSQFEHDHSRRAEGSSQQIEGTVVALTSDSVLLDIGFKSEGILPLTAFAGSDEPVKPGDKIVVSVKGRDPDGYYELSRFKTALPKDWSSLEQAFADKTTIMGTVTGVIKGGLTGSLAGINEYKPGSLSCLFPIPKPVAPVDPVRYDHGIENELRMLMPDSGFVETRYIPEEKFFCSRIVFAGELRRCLAGPCRGFSLGVRGWTKKGKAQKDSCENGPDSRKFLKVYGFLHTPP